MIQACWPHGYVQTDRLTPAAIAYVAGYCNKKVARRWEESERVDPATGEVYTYQPPFVQMSRGGRPSGAPYLLPGGSPFGDASPSTGLPRTGGIATLARANWSAWRLRALSPQGRVMPVPRYLHLSYLNAASPTQLQTLKLEQEDISYQQHLLNTPARLEAAYAIAVAKLKLDSEKRGSM
jgi:hypothetical protein